MKLFPNSYDFPLMQEFNPFYLCLVLYDRKHFCSVFTDSLHDHNVLPTFSAGGPEKFSMLAKRGGLALFEFLEGE